MATLRIRKKHSNFVLLDNGFLKNKSLSMKAKGLLAYLLSLPDDWKIYVSELVNNFSDGKHSVYSAINELKQEGYISQSFERSRSGTFAKSSYLVHEIPITQDEAENALSGQSPPYPGFPYTDNPDTENQTLLNIDNTKDLNNKRSTTAEQTATAISNEQTEAVAAVLSNKDLLIDTRLTASQKAYVASIVDRRLKQSKTIPGSRDECIRWINDTLQDHTAFSKAGHLFHKKLNTLLKALDQGQWHPNLETQCKSERGGPVIQTAQAIARMEITKQIHSLKSQYNSLIAAQTSPMAKDLTYRNSLTEGLKKIGQELQDLLNQEKELKDAG